MREHQVVDHMRLRFTALVVMLLVATYSAFATGAPGWILASIVGAGVLGRLLHHLDLQRHAGGVSED